MAFDEAEMDMIRRGDMLGPKLGAKVATALETLQRERDEAREALMGLVDLSDEVVDIASDNPDWEQVAYRFADALIRARAALAKGE